MQREIGDMQKTTQKCNGESCNKKPKDYIIATGQAYSVKQFVEIASNYLEMKIFEWKRFK